MAFFSNFFKFFKTVKEPVTETETPHIKRKQKKITPPKRSPFVQLSNAIKKGLQRQKQKKAFIPTTYTPPVQPEPEKTTEEKAQLYVQDRLEWLERKVDIAKKTYTNKDGSSALQKYQNDASIHDVLDNQMQQIRTFINDIINNEGYVSAMKRLNRVDWDQFDTDLFYYPTCLMALPDVYAQITGETTPLEATSVQDSSAQSDFEDDEFNF